MINTIYREICKIGTLRIGTILFLKSMSNLDYTKYKPSKAFKRYIGQSGEVALTYNFPTFIVIDYTMSSGTFMKDHKLFIALGQLAKLERFLRRTMKVVEDPNGSIFYLDADRGNKLCMYNLSSEDLKKVIIREGGFSGTHVLQSYPTIVTDYQENSYEGVTICIDRKENTVNLSYDELSALYYVVSKTDFVNLGQAMINGLSVWANTAITKHLDIDSARSTDYRQKNDISAEQERREQPTPQLGNNVFSNLNTK